MSVLRFEGAGLGRLHALHLTLEAGVHVVIGTGSDGASELVELAAGLRPPRRGRVEVDGRPPFVSPAARAEVAALLRVETLAQGDTVRAVVARTVALRGGSNPDRVLAEYGFDAWANRKIDGLSARERRTIALLLALCHEQARVFVLFEPLAVAPELDPDRVRSALEARARDGACVLAVTASTEDAIALGGDWFLLERGVVSRVPGQSEPPLGAPTSRALAVRCAEPRRLAEALAGRAELSGLGFDELQNPRELLVYGENPELVAQLVVRTARDHLIAIEALHFVAPPLEALIAAKDGWARAAYERAYNAYAASQANMAVRSAGGVYG